MWKTGKYHPPNRYFGYLFMLAWSTAMNIILLTFVLNFQLSEDPSAMGRNWANGYLWGYCYDFLFMQPVVVWVKSLVMVWLWNAYMPQTDDLESEQKVIEATFKMRLDRVQQSRNKNRAARGEVCLNTPACVYTGTVFLSIPAFLRRASTKHLLM